MNSSVDFTDEHLSVHKRKLLDAKRLRDLADTGLMDSLPDEAFDRAVRLATNAIGVPVSLISLVDANRQFFKAQAGLTGETAEYAQTPLSHSFCQYVVTSEQPLNVENALEHKVLKDNGATHDLSVIAYLGVPIKSQSGSTLGSFCAIDSKPRKWTERELAILTDISKLIELEITLRQEVNKRQLLMRELNHRVSNLFAIVSGMVSMTARSSDTVEDMRDVLRGRISALAEAHDLIRPGIDGRTDEETLTPLETLITALMKPYRRDAVKAAVQSDEPIMIGPKTTTDLALVLHEFATNAAKYGALSSHDGQVEISAKLDGAEVHLAWTELGGPEIKSAPERQGFGSRLIAAALGSDLRGALETHWKTTGVQHVIRFPAQSALR